MCLCRWTVDVKRQHQYETDTDFLIYQSLRLLRVSYTHSIRIYSCILRRYIHTLTHTFLTWTQHIFRGIVLPAAERGWTFYVSKAFSDITWFFFFFFFKKENCGKKEDSKHQSVSDCDHIRDDKRQIWLRLCQLVNHLYIHILIALRIVWIHKNRYGKRKEKKKKHWTKRKLPSTIEWMGTRQTDGASDEHVNWWTQITNPYTRRHIIRMFLLPLLSAYLISRNYLLRFISYQFCALFSWQRGNGMWAVPAQETDRAQKKKEQKIAAIAAIAVDDDDGILFVDVFICTTVCECACA